MSTESYCTQTGTEKCLYDVSDQGACGDSFGWGAVKLAYFSIKISLVLQIIYVYCKFSLLLRKTVLASVGSGPALLTWVSLLVCFSPYQLLVVSL